ncbi:S-layer homology domain-containing protein [Oscillospiraceae bacterium 38-13]
MRQTAHARRALLPGFAGMAALVLAALTLFAAFSLPAVQAAEWMEPYLEQVREWGVMRGDANGNMNEDRPITRAEFVTLVNRAFGYTQAGPHTFTDVGPNDWFAEDISIAHNVGYFQGTSPTTAAPYSLVTREQAAVLLGRSLRFQGVTGAANTTFTDMQDIGGWSRGLVQEAADLGIIQGYSDGTFRPDENITRGQMACFLVRALGTLIQEPGEQTSGGIYGNMTITTPGVKLKDTTITGNLYLTGGVGLGSIELENVNVLGKIVICGGGEAETGEHSIILRNVTAPTLEVDSLTGQFLSINAEGLTDIGTVTVRTPSFIQDLTEDGLGFQNIRLDGDPDFEGGVQLQVAGNIKNVVNLTPNSTLQVAQGVAKVVTMDERAENAGLTIDDKAVIKELNLDRGTEVKGPGNIDHLNINAPGSNVEMLPDTIFIRPGITGNVNKENMNTNTAAESSEEPRLLAGYPYAKNVAPTSADGVFKTNKAGTVYWALTSLMDGSLGEEELMNPGAYSAKIIRNGTVAVRTSNTEVTARLTGLTRQGSYYLSALLVDARGHRSPVKVTAFTTPDDSTPNFSTGYPQAPILTADADNEQIAQIMVMATKDCQMYYVLLPKGSAAPTAADFRAAALPGNLGFGIVTLRKNTPFLVSRINSSHLQEQTEYDLYLWLNDADNGKSSAVRKVTLKTLDKTPPTIQHLTVTKIAATSVTLSFALDEPGNFYWAVVKSGKAFYKDGVDPKNPGLAGKIQIENGTGSNVLRRGGPIRASRGSTDVSFNVSGLEPQTAYDLYFVAKDLAGNYCVYTQTLIPPITINTLDNEPPTVTQEFGNDGEGPASHPTPYPDSDVILVFSEAVLPAKKEGNDWTYDDFESRYQESQGNPQGQKIFADLLREHIKLYRKPGTGRPELVAERHAENEATIGSNWVIDYRYARVDRDGDGQMRIIFPYGEGINLSSGDTYYFVVSDIADASDAHNLMKHNTREGFQLPDFTTIDAQLLITPGSASGNVNGTDMIFDMNFRFTPEGTENVNDDVLWDVIFWADETLSFELYCDDGSGWRDLGEININTDAQQPRTGVSITKLLDSNADGIPNFEQLNHVSSIRNYGIMITRRGDSTDRNTWTGDVTLTLVPVAGDLSSLINLSGKNLTPAAYEAHQKGTYAVREIGVPREYQVSHPFTDTEPPTFIQGYPHFTPTDSSVSIDIMVSRNNCKYFCIVTEVGNIPTNVDGIPNQIDPNNWELLPPDGEDFDGQPGNATAPSNTSITRGDTFTGPRYLINNGSCGNRVVTIDFMNKLEADKMYIAYFVLQGDSPASASKVYAFRFRTQVISRPVLRVTINNPKAVVDSLVTPKIVGGTKKDAIVSYMVINALQTGDWLGRKMSSYWDTTYAKAMGVPDSKLAEAENAYKDLTLVEAMAVQYTLNAENLGSVFDLFTTPTVQEQVSAWFQTAQTSGTTILKVGIDAENLNSTNSWSRDIDCAQELKGQSGKYWFVAIGRNSDSSYAFSAARYLTDPNVQHPMVIALNFNYDRDETPSQPTIGEAANLAYTGPLTVSFDGPLYFADNGKLKKVVDLPAAALVGNTDDYISTDLIFSTSNSNGIQIVHDPNASLDRPCESLTFQITNQFRNATITFSQYLANEAGDFGQRGLVLKLEIVKEATGLYGADFVIDTQGWDQT